jgi:glycopeptide antibiotics resistance protein
MMAPNGYKSNSAEKGIELKVLWLLYSLFILYGTLIPFELTLDAGIIRSNIAGISMIPFMDPDGTRASIPDIVQNLLLFLPFGFIGYLTMVRKYDFSAIIVTFTGMALSSGVEIFQIFTIDRTTSMTDLVCNTGGAFLGAVSAMIVMDIYISTMNLSYFNHLRDDRFFALLLISAVIVGVGSLLPFDFTLDFGMFKSKVKSVIYNFPGFDPVLKDDLVVGFRFFLFSCVCGLWLRKKAVPAFFIIAILLSAFIGISLEWTQIIVKSRMPGFQDVVVILAGSILGGVFIKLIPEKLPPAIVALAVISATWLTAGVQVLSPFRFIPEHRGFNWIPFLSYYERTSFVALANFIESMLMFFPMGFILRSVWNGTKKVYWYILVPAVVMACTLEIPQGWVEGRYSDITDVIGATIGAAVGALVCSKWLLKYEK